MISFKKNGFTLIELILVVSIGLAISFMTFREMMVKQEDIEAKNAGQQIKQIGDSVNSYISIHYDTLSALTNSTGSSNDLGPRTCSTGTNSCLITIKTLINEGLLPQTYSDYNTFNSPYTIVLKRSGTAPYYSVTGMITTTNVWAGAQNKVRYDLLGKAMQEAGIDSGVSKDSATIINGYKGLWNQNASDYSNINKQGQLAYQVGYGSYSYSIYLRRDGTLPMTGNLNMGTKSINNAQDINGAGNLTMSGKGNFGGEVTAKNGYGDSITLGGDASSNDYELRLGSAKPLSIYSPSSTQYTTVLSINRNTVIGERLATNGLNPNDLPAGWGGGLRTYDVYAAGTVAAGNGGNIPAYMNSSGNIYASNNITTNTFNANLIQSSGNINAGADMNANRMYSNYVHSNGNVDANGDMNSNRVYSNYVHSNGNLDAAGQITSGSRLTTNEYLQINGVGYAGNGCSPNGLVGREPDGTALSCVNGAWKKSGALTRGACYWVGNPSGRDFTPKMCNLGDYVAGFAFNGHQRSESAYTVACCPQ